MNWDDLTNNTQTKKVLTHWQKLGSFRKKHPAVGGGVHTQISVSPYVFSRTFTKEGFKEDKVVVGLDLNKGSKQIPVGTIFTNGTKVKDAYSGKTGKVSDGKVTIDSEFDIVLLEKL